MNVMSDAVDIFGRSPERDAMNASMNGLIRSHAERGKTYGTLARSGGEPTTPLSAAQANLEAAKNAKDVDPDEVDFYEHRVTTLLDEARAGRQARDPDTGQFASFDGGSRGRRTFHRDSGQETPNDLMRKMFDRSREVTQENEREQTLTQSVIARNI